MSWGSGSRRSRHYVTPGRQLLLRLQPLPKILSRWAIGVAQVAAISLVIVATGWTVTSYPPKSNENFTTAESVVPDPWPTLRAKAITAGHRRKPPRRNHAPRK
jgi:hypothetical protein